MVPVGGTDLRFETVEAVDLKGLTVVFVHGAMSRGSHFRASTEWLSDFKTVIYDRRGYAGSRLVGTGNESYEDHASDLVGLIEANSNGAAVVIGHSHGAGIALLAAIRRPDLVRTVGLWEPLLGWLPWWDPYPRTMAARVAAMSDPVEITKDTLFHFGIDWDSVSADVRTRLIDQSPAYRADMRASLRAPFDLADLAVPVIVGIGSHGMAVARGPAPRLASELGTNLIELDTGHDIQREDPQLLAHFVREAVNARKSG